MSTEIPVEAAVPFEVTDEMLLPEWEAQRGVVAARLKGAGRLSDVDDVMQDVWLSISRSRANYDPGHGPLGGWVNRIAQRRAIDHLKRGMRVLDVQNAAIAEHGREATVPDVAEAIVRQIDSHEELVSTLDLAFEAMDNPVAFERTMSLIIHFDEQVDVAATALGVSPSALRASRRETLRMACVVARALAARREGKTATMRVLLSCLPERHEMDAPAPTDQGAGHTWIHDMTITASMAGGFDRVTPDSLMAVTGLSANTCRQYLAQTRDLLVVARTVIEYGRGRLTADPISSPDPAKEA